MKAEVFVPIPNVIYYDIFQKYGFEQLNMYTSNCFRKQCFHRNNNCIIMSNIHKIQIYIAKISLNLLKDYQEQRVFDDVKDGP